MQNDQPSPDEIAAMREAVDRALRAKDQYGKAGIAAAILRDGVAIGRGENEVSLTTDPTESGGAKTYHGSGGIIPLRAA